MGRKKISNEFVTDPKERSKQWGGSHVTIIKRIETESSALRYDFLLYIINNDAEQLHIHGNIEQSAFKKKKEMIQKRGEKHIKNFLPHSYNEQKIENKKRKKSEEKVEKKKKQKQEKYVENKYIENEYENNDCDNNEYENNGYQNNEYQNNEYENNIYKNISYENNIPIIKCDELEDNVYTSRFDN